MLKQSEITRLGNQIKHREKRLAQARPAQAAMLRVEIEALKAQRLAGMTPLERAFERFKATA